MTKIKICGLKREVDIIYANKLKPDYVGFVFLPKSHRFVKKQKAQLLRQKLDDSIKSVGVFVNEPIRNIEQLFDCGTISVAQLHGRENDDYIKALKAKGITTIKAFNVQTEQDVSMAAKSCADLILLDNGMGGTGKTFDWSLLNNIGRQFFLAGGLNSLNVKEAIESTHPYAVDTSSGVETNFVKDFSRMETFIKAVRTIE